MGQSLNNQTTQGAAKAAPFLCLLAALVGLAQRRNDTLRSRSAAQAQLALQALIKTLS